MSKNLGQRTKEFVDVDSTYSKSTEANGIDRHESRKIRKRKRAAELEDQGGTSLLQKAVAESYANTPKRRKKKKDKSLQDPVHPRTRASSPEITEFLLENAINIDGQVTPVLSFEQLDIPSELRPALITFSKPTPIQSCAWPALLAGRDVVGIAETGSGKTLAFCLPALVHLLSNPMDKNSNPAISVLVVAPTRELAIQTHETMGSLGGLVSITSISLFGGVDKEPQKRTLMNRKGLRIAVGTPGRILDLLAEKSLDLSRVSYIVLDEADRMLDKGFENDIREIISHTMDIKDRQTLMFSATWPESVRQLASTFMRNPVRITVGGDKLSANSRVEQVVEVFDDPRSKQTRLSNLLRSLQQKNTAQGTDESRVLIFALYKLEASRIYTNLRKEGYSVGVIHGDLLQQQRLAALDDFKTGRVGVLVATDVAARGLDIPNVGIVVNVTFPLTIEDYIHRIGRTGRGGKSGQSITFFTGEKHERALAGELMRVLRESGFDAPGLNKFPMTVKKKTHSVYGAFFRDDVPMVAPTKIKF